MHTKLLNGWPTFGDQLPVLFAGSAFVSANGQSEWSVGNSTPMIEVLPFEDAPKAYERMMSGHARFRVVLDVAGD